MTDLSTDRIYYVYAHFRKDTGEMFYVGMGKNKRAWDKFGRNRYWHRIVDKAGYDVMILYPRLTRPEAAAREIGVIADVHPVANLTKGGDGGNSLAGKSDEWKRNHYKKLAEFLRETRKGAGNPMFGKRHSIERKAALREMNSGERHPMYGKPRSPETIAKLKKANGKPVTCIETGIVFDSIKDCARHMGVCRVTIGKCVKSNGKKSIRGLTFREST